MEALRAEYTEVWCASANVPLARFADCARSIAEAGLDRVGLLPAEDVMARLRTFDSIMSWYGTGNEDFRTQMEGLPVEFLAALPPRWRGSGGCHASEFYYRQVTAGERICPAPAIAVPKVARTFAAIHPFASNSGKRAPFGMFEQCADRLAARMCVEWLCGPEEQLEGAVQIGDLYELACYLAGARVFVGNDSGISHLAAAVGTPVLALFKNTDARVWQPRGRAVHVSYLSVSGG